MVALGPGILKIGTAGSPTDYSCLVNGMTLTTDVAVGDSTFKLCGTQIPGTLTPTGTLAGNVDQDIDAATGGLFEYCSKNWGNVAAFIFEPSTTAGLEADGQLLVVPLAFGGDTYGDPMVSDVSFTTVGDINFKRAGTTAWTQAMSPKQGVLPPATAATGATAGTPGTWTPPGSTPPASVATIGSVVASPATAWTTGQYVQTATAGTPGQAHWSGTAWVAGAA
jgi:hypothetical protein